MSELVSTMTAREVASQATDAIRALRMLASDHSELADPREVGEVIADLERMSEDLPQLCELLARFLVVQHEDGQITLGAAEDTGLSVAVATEALSAASQAADMMTAALTEARIACTGLRQVR